MPSFSNLLKLGLAHRQTLHTAYNTPHPAATLRSEALDFASTSGTTAATAPLRAAETIPRLVVRGLQFLFALIMVGIYGVRVGSDSATSAVWRFGLVVGVMACVSAVVLAFAAPLGAVVKSCKVHHLFGWDLALALLWIVVFGVFMGIFHGRTAAEGEFEGSSTTVEKAVTWIDLVNALLWLLSGAYGGVKTWMAKKREAALRRGRGLVEERTDRLFGGQQMQQQQPHQQDEKEVYDYSSSSESDKSVSEPARVYYQGRPNEYAGYQV